MAKIHGDWKRGDVHPQTGKVFWCYRNCGKYQTWMSLERFNQSASDRTLKSQGYYERNRNHILDQTKTYQLKNPEVQKTANHLHYQRNKAAINQKAVLWRKANPEKFKAIAAKHAKGKAWYYRASSAARRALIKSTSDVSMKAFIDQFYKAAQRVSACLGIKFEVDHVKPLSRKGRHVLENLQLLPKILNIRKLNHEDFALPDCYNGGCYSFKN